MKVCAIGVAVAMMLCLVIARTALANDENRIDEGVAILPLPAIGDDDAIPLGNCLANVESDALWVVSAGAVFFSRSDSSLNLATLAADDPSLPSAIDFGYGTVAGVDASVARAVGVDQAVEVRFLGGNDWNSSQTIPLDGQGDPIDLAASYNSRLYSTEINLWQPGNGWFRWLAGFRWIELHERMQFDAGELGDPDAVAFTYATHNHLYGGQLGADLQVLSRGPLRANALLKAGVFGNSAANELAVAVPIFAQVTTLTADTFRGQVAFAGEIDLIAAYQVSRHITVRGGYELLWLDGLALAGDQLAEFPNLFSNGGIATDGAAFFHGAVVDVVLTW